MAPGSQGRAVSGWVIPGRRLRSSLELGLPPINLLRFQGKSIFLAPFTDSRPDPDVIGENRENQRQTPFPKVITHDDAPKWITARWRAFFANLLKNPGFLDALADEVAPREDRSRPLGPGRVLQLIVSGFLAASLLLTRSTALAARA
jgi:hypothetical protein